MTKLDKQDILLLHTVKNKTELVYNVNKETQLNLLAFVSVAKLRTFLTFVTFFKKFQVYLLFFNKIVEAGVYW